MAKLAAHSLHVSVLVSIEFSPMLRIVPNWGIISRDILSKGHNK